MKYQVCMEHYIPVSICFYFQKQLELSLVQILHTYSYRKNYCLELNEYIY